MKNIDTPGPFRLFYTGLVQALRLNNAGQKSSQLGQMINLMQVDAQKFQVCFSLLLFIYIFILHFLSN